VVSVHHMAYLRPGAAGAGAAAEEEEEEEGDEAAAAAAAAADPLLPPAEALVAPRLVFLYKLTEGAADASFGLNAAAMAGIGAAVVGRAAVVAQSMRRRTARQARASAAAAAAAAAAEAEDGNRAALVQALREALKLRGGGADWRSARSAAVAAVGSDSSR